MLICTLLYRIFIFESENNITILKIGLNANLYNMKLSLFQDMRCMLIWTTLIFNLKCCMSIENELVYNFHHTSTVLYFCDVKDSENTDFHCYGNLTDIPKNLSKDLRKLSVTDADIKYFKKEYLDAYRETLEDM